jgi:tol-pal system protein YbgF
MRIQNRTLFTVLAAAALAATPAWGVNREIVELQTQVQQLQTQLTTMQQSLDERMGVLKHLMDQNTDSINKMTTAVTSIQGGIQKEQSDTGNRIDQISGQLQALNDSLDELKARVAKASKQIEDMQAAQQSLAAQQSQQAQQQKEAMNVPPPDVLYNNALRDYNGGNVDLARQEFSDYVKNYANTDLAGNSFFYLAELDYRAGNYPQAIQGYDQVLQAFPDGNKAASAELKKGFAQIESGQKDAGISTLRHVLQRYPRSNEAAQAKDRLRKLGVATASAGRRGEQ